MTRTDLPRAHVLASAGADIVASEWAARGVALAFNRQHIDLIERHQAQMEQGFARAEALLEAMRKEKRL